MNDLLKFSFKGKEVRSLVVDNEPWFVGKDIATILGYSNPHKAIRDHVDEEDKRTERIVHPHGGAQNTLIINESGLYSLIFASKLEEAKEFKHLVTSEILPSIRKYGHYGVYPVKATSLGEVARTMDVLRKSAKDADINPIITMDAQLKILYKFGISLPDFTNEINKKKKLLEGQKKSVQQLQFNVELTAIEDIR